MLLCRLGMLGEGETVGASALFPKGSNDQTYFALNGALPIGIDGFTAKERTALRDYLNRCRVSLGRD